MSLIPPCDAPFILPTMRCRLPQNHMGEHAPNPIATAMIALQIMNDELETDRREFDAERKQLRAQYHACMGKLRALTIAVGSIGCVSITIMAISIFQITT